MAFDETLADRVRSQLRSRAGIIEKKMFGGLAFLLDGNMSVGIRESDLIVRLDPAETDAALQEDGVRVFDLTGRPMKGWLMVGLPAIANDVELERWVRRGADYAASLPAK